MSRSSCQSGHTRRSRLSCSAGRFAPARTAPRASPSASSLLAVLAAAEPAVAADASARALRARPRAADPRRCYVAALPGRCTYVIFRLCTSTQGIVFTIQR